MDCGQLGAWRVSLILSIYWGDEEEHVPAGRDMEYRRFQTDNGQSNNAKNEDVRILIKHKYIIFNKISLY